MKHESSREYRWAKAPPGLWATALPKARGRKTSPKQERTLRGQADGGAGNAGRRWEGGNYKT